MKSLRIVIALLASGLVAVGEEDVEKGQQQRIAELLDQQLNDVYQRVTDSATSEHAQNIREAQRSWLKYRDAEVKAVDLRLHDGNKLWEKTRDDDREFRQEQLTLARIEELSRQLRYDKDDYAPQHYVGEYGVMLGELGVSLDIKDAFDAFKAEAHRGIDGKSGTHFSIFGSARITAPHVLTITGTGRDAAKALMLGDHCILYWENFRFFLLSRYGRSP